MKKTERKLTLHRETLQILERSQLQKVAAGASTPAYTCGCVYGAFDGYIRG